MDETAVAGMIFSLIVLAMIGGFIVLFPLSRRLGHVLDAWLLERKQGVGEAGQERLREREVIGRLVERLEAIEERQAFIEELIARKGDAAGLRGADRRELGGGP